MYSFRGENNLKDRLDDKIKFHETLQEVTKAIFCKAGDNCGNRTECREVAFIDAFVYNKKARGKPVSKPTVTF